MSPFARLAWVVIGAGVFVGIATRVPAITADRCPYCDEIHNPKDH